MKFTPHVVESELGNGPVKREQW